MIDDYTQALKLVDKMKDTLPIPAFPTKPLVRLMRDKGQKISFKKALSIKAVFYLGDEGGISCDVTPSKDLKENWIVSITHLRIPRKHPLYKEIYAYQQERINQLR